jgi:putative transposase
MARLPRIVVPNQPLHIMHRGNNRQDIFESEDDMFRIKNDIKESLLKSKCKLHAYVIMKNHLHLLLTPSDKEQLVIFMQSMANRYARYFNTKHKRTGTIWEGRVKSCLIDSEAYLFVLYKYIEMNPIKAGMVKNLKNYRWSSYPHNALGIADELVTEHLQYKRFGQDKRIRCQHYKSLFNELDSNQDKEITDATMRGIVYGKEKFHRKVGRLISRPTRLVSHGGDRKSEEFQNQVG